KLDWGFPATGALDTAYTEIQVSPDGSSNIAALGMFAYPTNTHKIQGLQPNLIQFYRARLVDRIGNVGPWSSWTSSTTSADASAVLDILSGKITESQLHQDLHTKIDKIDATEGDIADLIVAVQNAENGVTQERKERIAGDNQVLNQLTIYKVSNDQAVAAVVEDVDVLTTNQGALSTKIDGVFAQVNPPLIGSESDLIGNEGGYAGVWSEQSARIEGDLAQAIRTDTVQTDLNGNKAAVQEVTKSVNGLYAQKFIKLDVNGKIAGWGGANDGVESQFIFNFDSIAIGNGSNGTVSYPFIFRNTPYTDPNTGTVFPVGAYMKSAFMDYASIDTAHIKDLAVKSAQIDDLAVTSGKISDLAVSTLKIQDEAVTVPVGVNYSADQTYPNAEIYTRSHDALGASWGSWPTNFESSVSLWEAGFGTIGTITLNRKGGKALITATACLINPSAGNIGIAVPNGSGYLSAAERKYCRMVLSVYRGTTLVARTHIMPSGADGNSGIDFNGTLTLVAVDDSPITGTVTYTMTMGAGYIGPRSDVIVVPQQNSSIRVTGRSMSIVELKK
ncbi:hypothetical protein MSG86_18170, partial [Acinetobacter baumannii]|nr:hypothetical protein [Acinetobacter baumannii]